MYTSNLLKGRGVMIYVKKSLNTYNMDPPNDYEEAVWCQIKLNNKNEFLTQRCI